MQVKEKEVYDLKIGKLQVALGLNSFTEKNFTWRDVIGPDVNGNMRFPQITS